MISCFHSERQLLTTIWNVIEIQQQTILSFVQPSPIVAPKIYLNSCAPDLEQVKFHQLKILGVTTGG